MLDLYLDYIQEGYLLSDKTISVDLDRFDNNESNILLIIGIPASGKTTLGKKLSKFYRAEYIDTDRLCLNNKNVKDPEVCFRNLYRKFSKSNKQYIVEGVLVYWSSLTYPDNKFNPFFNEIRKTPIIILGTSLFRSLIQGFKRERPDASLKQIFDWYVKNNIEDLKVLNKFRNERIKDSKVEEMSKDFLKL